ncbi:MAG: hypothetical protein MZU79_00710 [Anaerotruncus sp.]|nr:hypothetical protein [Anaerotruncus sp.]
MVALCFLGGVLGLAAHDPAAPPAHRAGGRRAAVSRGHRVRRGAAGDGGPARAASAVDLPGHGCRRRDRRSPSRWPSCSPRRFTLPLPVLPKAQLALELAPALFGVGYILGYRQAAICVCRVAGLVARPHAAHRLDRRTAGGTALPRDGPAGRPRCRRPTSGRATCATSARARWRRRES